MLTIYLSMLDDPDDRRKFEELYKKYRQMMYYVAYRILKSVDDAEDAVHMAFMRVINHLDDIDENEEQKTKSYLAIVVQNLAYDMYRKKKRDWTLSCSYDAFELYIQDPNGQDFEDIDDGSEGIRLAEAMKKLPAKYADVIRLTYMHGLHSEKVGEILGITSDTVRQRLVRGRKKLAELMKEAEKKENKGNNDNNGNNGGK